MEILTAFLTVAIALTAVQAIYSDLQAVQAVNTPSIDRDNEPVSRGNGRR